MYKKTKELFHDLRRDEEGQSLTTPPSEEYQANQHATTPHHCSTSCHPQHSPLSLSSYNNFIQHTPHSRLPTLLPVISASGQVRSTEGHTAGSGHSVASEASSSSPEATPV